MRLIRDGDKGGRGYGGGGERESIVYTYRYTVTTRMTSALIWAVYLPVTWVTVMETGCFLP